MKAVEVLDLKVWHPLQDDPALNGVNISCHQGKIYGVIGQNGSGKSTLCHAIRRLIPGLLGGKTTGDIRINGRPLSELSDEELVAAIGLVFDNPYTQITGVCLTVYEEVAYGLENLKISCDEIFDRTSKLLVDLELDDLAFRDPMELSGGQRQRVSLASVLAMDTQVVVIDEPTSQLDPQSTTQIFDIIRLLRGQGKTVILVENKLDQLMQVVDELIVMDQGNVVCAGLPGDVLPLAHKRAIPCGYPEIFTLSLALKNSGLINDYWTSLTDARASLSTRGITGRRDEEEE